MSQCSHCLDCRSHAGPGPNGNFTHMIKLVLCQGISLYFPSPNGKGLGNFQIKFHIYIRKIQTCNANTAFSTT